MTGGRDPVGVRCFALVEYLHSFLLDRQRARDIMVCEMAGNYELPVSLMFALGIAFIALRKHSANGKPYSTFAPATPAAEMLRKEIARVYLQAASRAEDAARSMQKMPTIRPDDP